MFKRRLNKYELALFAIPLVFGLVCSSRLFSILSQDDLEKKARLLAGPNPIDCGRIVVESGREASAARAEADAKQCAATAFQQGKPFVYRRERHNTNHLNYHSMMIGTEKGKVYQLWGKNDNQDKSGLPIITDAELLHPQVKNIKGSPQITWKGWRRIN